MRKVSEFFELVSTIFVAATLEHLVLHGHILVKAIEPGSPLVLV